MSNDVLDEMVLVGPVERFYHLVEVYRGLADLYPEDRESWLDAAAWVIEALPRQ